MLKEAHVGRSGGGLKQVPLKRARHPVIFMVVFTHRRRLRSSFAASMSRIEVRFREYARVDRMEERGNQYLHFYYFQLWC